LRRDLQSLAKCDAGARERSPACGAACGRLQGTLQAAKRRSRRNLPSRADHDPQ
jgi:hypothetical protein